MKPWVFVKLVLFTVVVPGTVTVLVPNLLLGATARRIAPLGWLGLLPIAAGAAVYFRCAWDFGAAGQGTPAPIDPPKRLVIRGLYRWVRNPMYLGVLLVLFGESLLFGSAVLLRYALLAWVVFHTMVVVYEERVLRREFGAEYDEYRRRVPRWLPRPPRQERNAPPRSSLGGTTESDGSPPSPPTSSPAAPRFAEAGSEPRTNRFV